MPTTTKPATRATTAPQRAPTYLRAVLIGTTCAQVKKYVNDECWKSTLKGIEDAVIEQHGAEVHVIGKPVDVSRIVGLLAFWNVLHSVQGI